MTSLGPEIYGCLHGVWPHQVDDQVNDKHAATVPSDYTNTKYSACLMQKFNYKFREINRS